MLTKEQIFGLYLPEQVMLINADNLKGVIAEVSVIQYALFGSPPKNKMQLHVSYGSLISGYTFIDDCKLILRPFESLTEEEVRILLDEKSEYFIFKISKSGIRYNTCNCGICDDDKWQFAFKHCSVRQTEYLISIGIDVFDCYSRGWCIYESEVLK